MTSNALKIGIYLIQDSNLPNWVRFYNITLNVGLLTQFALNVCF